MRHKQPTRGRGWACAFPGVASRPARGNNNTSPFVPSRRGVPMPTMLDCPTCNHPVPVTESTRATPVECPYCARAFTAYGELGDDPTRAKPRDAKGKKGKSKRRRDDDDDDDDDDNPAKKT